MKREGAVLGIMSAIPPIARSFKSNEIKLLLMVSILTASLLATSNTTTKSITTRLTKASPTTVVAIYPASVTGIIVGETFKVNVTVSNVNDLWAWKAKFSWNSSCVSLVKYGSGLCDFNITEGPFLKNVDSTVFVFTPPNETGGYIKEMTCQLLSPSGATGNGTLATITLNATSPSTSLIWISDTLLLDWVNSTYKREIPHTVVNGTVKTVACLCDFDRDYDIDNDDILYFVDAYIKYWSGQGKDPLCDLDNDCDIDYDDILVFVSAYIDYWTP